MAAGSWTAAGSRARSTAGSVRVSAARAGGALVLPPESWAPLTRSRPEPEPEPEPEPKPEPEPEP